jgi:hypothetical protein
VDLRVWEGMPHLFASSFAMLEAGEASMAMIADFVRAEMSY